MSTTTGVLVIDKPAGPTSFDVVRQVRRALRTRRVGHGGTLDPMASGVLPICLGEATKLAQFLLDADKEYEATLCFGVETDTYDATGTVTDRRDAAGLHRRGRRGRARRPSGARSGRCHRATRRSSCDGRPLYDYARAGEAVDPAPRTRDRFTSWRWRRWIDPTAVVLRLRCSKGTYVRSLAFDLGRALGAGAHLTALRRTRSGPFRIDEAHPLDALETAPLDRPVRKRWGTCRPCTPGVDAARSLEQGKRVPWTRRWQATPQRSDARPTAPPPGRFQVLRPDGTLLAVAEVRDDDTLRTLRVFD